MFYNGMRQVISRTSTYHNSEDLHGQKIRVAQNDLDIKTWDAMGGSPTPHVLERSADSLSTGTIEALDHSLGVFNDSTSMRSRPTSPLPTTQAPPSPLCAPWNGSSPWIPRTGR